MRTFQNSGLASFDFGVVMTLVRVGWVVGLSALFLVMISCGETYRPVAIPITPTPPTPSSLHYVLSLSSNGVCPPQFSQPCGPGANSRIDVSGDSNVGVAQVGLGPVHAALLPGGSDVYVANNLEDTVSFYSPSSIAPVSTVSLPAGSKPVFVATTETATVYVANQGTSTTVPPTLPTVAAIQVSSGVTTNFIPVGANPVALAETPDGKKVYVANQGSSTVSVINSLDKSVGSTIPTGASPVWLAARTDSARVYVLNSGGGTVQAIDTASDAPVGSASVGAGGNFMLYEKTRNRLYITNPVAATLTALDVSSDTLKTLGTVSFAASSAACPAGCVPTSVAALPDGSRIYVASENIAASCTQPADANSAGCITSRVTVIQAADFSVTKIIPITLPDTATSPATTKPDTPVVARCGTARFRLFAAAAADSSRVYVAYCDAGGTAIVRTTPNTSPGSENSGDYLVGSLNAPVSALSPPAPGMQPPPQNPVFVLAAP
jgi:YVTN family beta-propeller protein